ncbi:baculoviral IAP repeat-containing protein 2-like isoform X2 [Ornithodoros turicata]|uniref:baculoviral IAP repeat-containing protein 2-like isoform X2 n=1 Tax=Ornithodoros turicata TaxID=34597 RepID=UPI003138E4A8
MRSRLTLQRQVLAARKAPENTTADRFTLLHLRKMKDSSEDEGYTTMATGASKCLGEITNETGASINSQAYGGRPGSPMQMKESNEDEGYTSMAPGASECRGEITNETGASINSQAYSGRPGSPMQRHGSHPENGSPSARERADYATMAAGNDAMATFADVAASRFNSSIEPRTFKTVDLRKRRYVETSPFPGVIPGSEPREQMMRETLQTLNAPITPRFQQYEDRMRSFYGSRLQAHGEQFIKDLAREGFYYSGNGDEVVCFFCGCRLGNWRHGQRRFRGHGDYYPSCSRFRS